MRDRSPGPDQLVPNLPRERKVGQAVVARVEVPEVPTAEPVDGGWWNSKPALARATPPLSLLTPGHPKTSRSIGAAASWRSPPPATSPARAPRACAQLRPVLQRHPRERHPRELWHERHQHEPFGA